MRNSIIALTVCLVCSLLIGCTSKDKTRGSGASLIQTTMPPAIELKTRPEDQSIAFQVRKDLNDMDDIYDAAVIEGKKYIVVAYKVNHLKRFRMKKIEKEITDQLEKKYPEDHFIVSSDYKIFLEAIRLKDDLDNHNLSNKEAEKRFKHIIKLKKETV